MYYDGARPLFSREVRQHCDPICDVLFMEEDDGADDLDYEDWISPPGSAELSYAVELRLTNRISSSVL